MRTLSADWMANTSKPESELQSHGGEDSKMNFFFPRPVAPTAAQVFNSFLPIIHACPFLSPVNDYSSYSS